MIRITDMTLSCLDGYDAPSAQLRRLAELLVSIRVDVVELSPAAYRKIGTLPEGGRYLLRLQTPDEAEEFPEFSRFICRKGGMPACGGLVSELQINDMREAYMMGQGAAGGVMRVTGLDDALLHDACRTFGDLRARLPGRIEFCPEDRCGCATALAVEWVLSGGTDIVAAFGGVGRKAALEEVLLALRLAAHHRPGNQYAAFPEIKRLLEEITGVLFPVNKAVIGENIFAVESGIHVDGILKRQQIYEPFVPELVGNARRIVMGKHSGLKSTALKLEQAGLDAALYHLPELLSAVKAMSICRRRSLSDMEFWNLSRCFRKEDGILDKNAKTPCGHHSA